MSSTRSVMWCSPGPRLSTNLAMGDPGAVDSRSSSFDSPTGKEARTHVLAVDVLGRFNVQSQAVAVERERGREVLHGDSDVIEDGSFQQRFITKTRRHTKDTKKS